jgi:phosphoglycolate phosphatase-like HAD superfamily hydrolase
MNLIDKIKVVVLDCYGTIVGYGMTQNQRQKPRKGLIEFLDRMKARGITLVIATDDDNVARVHNYLKEIGVVQYFMTGRDRTDGDLHYPNINQGIHKNFNFYGYYDLNFDSHKHGDKDFAKIAEDHGVGTDEVYFVGDNGVGRDKRSAERYNVQWTNCAQYHPNAKFGDVYDFNSILQTFAWDDEKVKDFTRFYSSGTGPRLMADKLEHFKKAIQKGDSR